MPCSPPHAGTAAAAPGCSHRAGPPAPAAAAAPPAPAPSAGTPGCQGLEQTHGHLEGWEHQVPPPATPQSPCLSFPPPQGEEKAAMTLPAAPMGTPAASKQLCLPSPRSSVRGCTDYPGTPAFLTQQHPLLFQPPRGIQKPLPQHPRVLQSLRVCIKFPQQQHVPHLSWGVGGGGTGGRFQSDSAIPSQTRLSQILSRAPPTTLGVPPQTQGKPPFLHPFISPKLSPGSSCVPSVPPCTDVLRSLPGKEGHVHQSTHGRQGHPKTSLTPKPLSHPSAA